jgi:hypothetical protein
MQSFDVRRIQNLSEIPEELCQWNLMKEVYLLGNAFVMFPPVILEWKHLTRVLIGDIKMEKIPGTCKGLE